MGEPFDDGSRSNEEQVAELKERIKELEEQNEKLQEELDTFKQYSEDAYDALKRLW